MGLACSRSIAKEMGGDIVLKESKKGLTVFAFKIPVKVEEPNQEQNIESNLPNNFDEENTPTEILTYINKNNFELKNLSQIDF